MGPIKTWTYESMAEFADAAARNRTGTICEMSPSWYLGLDITAAVRMAKAGWLEKLPAALELAESAVIMAEKEHMMESFNQPVWDVTGAQVDIGAFLAGTPECMIDYPLSETSKVGRVVTLVSSCTFSGGFDAEEIVRRGELITALALALNQLGHAVEIWLSCNVGGRNGGAIEVLVKVKGTDDILDPAVAMFALAHPAILRRLMFSLSEGFPGKWKEGANGRVMSVRPESFPAGAIIIPDALLGRDTDPERFLKKYLGELGLLAE